MKRIVVADDSTTARMFVVRCLEIVGFSEAEFLEAEHGKQALEILKERGADLLITDLNMPEMDGTTLLKRIKASPSLVDLPVVVVSSLANQAKNDELLEAGALAVLDKPVNPPALKAVLEQFLQPKEQSDGPAAW